MAFMTGHLLADNKTFRSFVYTFYSLFSFLLVIRCVMARFASIVVKNCVFDLRMPEFLRIKK